MRSTFRELEAFARAGLAVFFAFAFARVAGQQTLGLEGGAQIRVKFEERAGNAMADRAGLAVGAAAATFTRTSNLSVVPVTVNGWRKPWRAGFPAGNNFQTCGR